MMRCSLALVAVLVGRAAEALAVPRVRLQRGSRSGRVAWPRLAAASEAEAEGLAASGGGAVSTEVAAAASPTLRELRDFALPALALWISGPVLTLIDTSSVGLFAGRGSGGGGGGGESALEIAALGPGGSVCDGAGYVFAFLNIATTNLYASAGDEAEREAVVARGARLACACGLAAVVGVRVVAGPFLRVFIGSAGTGAAEVQRRAGAYVRTRALGLPFLLVGNVLTAALLGRKDSVSPLVALGASAGANVAGDLLAVGALGRGVRGAAEATALSQVVFCCVLARQASRALSSRGDQEGRGTRAYVRGLLANGGARATTAARGAGKTFSAFAGPVLVLVFSKLLSFGVLTQGAARLGAVPLAAHQLAFTLYLLASLVLDAMAGQTAQAFLPPLLAAANQKGGATDDDDDGRAAPRRLAAKLGQLAGLSAVVVAGATALLAARGASLFSPDAALAASLRGLAKPLAASVLVHGAVAHGEGILLASADLAFVGVAYLASALLFPPAVFLAARRGALASTADLWAAFLAFQVARATCFQLRARALLLRSATPEAPNPAAASP